MTKLIACFLLRNKVKYEIIILLFLAVYNSFQSDSCLYGVIYSFTLLSILYLIYFYVLARQKGRINLLYNGATVKRLKYDVIKGICILSISLLIIVAFVDLFLLHAFYLTIYHLGTLITFVLSTFLVEIHLEKESKDSKKIITFKEGCKTVGLGLSLYLIMSVILFRM